MRNNHKDTRIEARLMGAVLAFELAKGMLCGGFWVMSPVSITGKVALLSTYPAVVGVVWIALSTLVLPYLTMQLFGIGQRYRAKLSRLACRAILASGVIWCYLAYLSKNLDYDFVTVIFLFNGMTCICTSAVLAIGLNRSQRIAEEAQQ